MSQEIVDNPARQRYELAIDGALAFVAYRRSPGVITFVHAEVPSALGGHGVAAFIGKNSEFQDLVATST